ncbi:glycosyltransferase 87 family protein [Streptomyces sp. V4-01]|uniref:Glycosyltransferase 87 family protein n=1 Tax=Actinacidiphila polyblastidii TaxID=3110430 RepID=A0ABU7P3U5_9ACTN|nr:glycosyltransferase 87 family protein [Streptomyces sp. V4-01]
MTALTTDVSPAPERERLPGGTALAVVAIAAIVATLAVTALALRDRINIESDFQVFHRGATAVLHGVDPFDVATAKGFLFTYPPFAALVMAPLGLLGTDTGYALWTFASVPLLAGSIWTMLKQVDSGERAARTRLTLTATVLSLFTAPVLLHLDLGQINILLMFITLADLVRRPGRTQGVAVGIAAGMKLTPLIYVAYFLITRRFRAAAVSAATFAGTVLIGFAVLPGASAKYWTKLVFDTGRIITPGAGPYVQSLRGQLAQLPGVLHANWFWMIVAVVVGLAGLALSAWAYRLALEPLGIIACTMTELLISPISWPPHWVWVAPVMALWAWWALRRRSLAHALGLAVVWLLLVGSALLTFMMQWGAVSLSKAGLLLLNSLPLLLAFGFLAVLAGVLRRRAAVRAAAEPRPVATAPA